MADSDGNVTTTGIGTADIIATANNGVSDHVTVTVIAPLAVSIKLSSEEITGEPGVIFTATVTPAEASEQTLEWSSSDKSVATVSEGGTVTITGIGNAVITVSTTDGANLSALCHIFGVYSLEAIFADLDGSTLRGASQCVVDAASMSLCALLPVFT